MVGSGCVRRCPRPPRVGRPRLGWQWFGTGVQRALEQRAQIDAGRIRDGQDRRHAVGTDTGGRQQVEGVIQRRMRLVVLVVPLFVGVLPITVIVIVSVPTMVPVIVPTMRMASGVRGARGEVILVAQVCGKPDDPDDEQQGQGQQTEAHPILRGLS